MWPAVRNYVVANGRLRRVKGFDTGRLLHEDPEGFERVRAKGLRSAWAGFAFFTGTAAVFALISVFLIDLEFLLVISFMWVIFPPQELLSVRSWRNLDHGQRIHEKGVETFMVLGWYTSRHFIPLDEVTEWTRTEGSVHLKAKGRWMRWQIDADQVGAEGLELLASLLDGSYAPEAAPPRLVLYPT